jgi:hypothetical protein
VTIRPTCPFPRSATLSSPSPLSNNNTARYKESESCSLIKRLITHPRLRTLRFNRKHRICCRVHPLLIQPIETLGSEINEGLRLVLETSTKVSQRKLLVLDYYPETEAETVFWETSYFYILRGHSQIIQEAIPSKL